MKFKNIIRFVVHQQARLIPFAFRRDPGPVPPPEQLTLDLDQATATGLSLREALPVRSAEYWLELGEPHLALKALHELPEPARQHPWPRRVLLNAILATTACFTARN